MRLGFTLFLLLRVILALAIVGCSKPAPAPQPAPQSAAQPPEVVTPEAAPAYAAFPQFAGQTVPQLPPYSGPCRVCTGDDAPDSLTVVISGNSWRGGSLDGTYTLTRCDECRWSYSLPAPIGGAVRLEADLLGAQRLAVRVFELRPGYTTPGAEWSDFNWFTVWPTGPTRVDCLGWSNVVLPLRAGNMSRVECPVAGTASVTAN